jgi:hypothetical protein
MNVVAYSKKIQRYISSTLVLQIPWYGPSVGVT